jgi:hypothetical protein
MAVTVDLVRLPRRRDSFRLLRRPTRFFARRPAFARALVVAPGFRSIDPRAVVLLARWDGEPAVLSLPGADVERATFTVQRTHGSIAGADPLGVTDPGPSAGAGAIWTCGNVRLRKVPAFLRMNARVLRELGRSPGLSRSIGILGMWRGGPWMCTLTFWDDLDAGLAFAYRSSSAHRDAIRAMRSGAFGTRESYFARLCLLDADSAGMAA